MTRSESLTSQVKEEEIDCDESVQRYRENGKIETRSKTLTSFR